MNLCKQICFFSSFFIKSPTLSKEELKIIDSIRTKPTSPRILKIGCSTSSKKQVVKNCVIFYPLPYQTTCINSNIPKNPKKNSNDT